MANEKQRIAVVYHHIPKFRQAVFEELWADDENEYTIVSDIETIIPALKLADQDVVNRQAEQGRFIRVKNWWFGQSICWQSKISRPSFVRKFDTIIYLGSMYHLSNWVSTLLARLMRRRVLYWTHGFVHREDNLKGRLRRIFYRLAHGMLLYDHRAKKIMIDYGFDPATLYVVYNSLDYAAQKKHRESVDPEVVAKIKRDRFENSDLPILIYLGRITSEKNPELMVDVVERLRNEGTDVNVLLIGNGPEEDAIRARIDQKQLQHRICMYGPCYDESELAPLMAAADIAIIPGHVGLSAMHYMAYGLPVLTSDDLENQKPEVEAITAGKTGGFFKDGNVEDLAHLVEQWLEKDKTEVRQQCIAKIEQQYNPKCQNQIINYAVKGLDARQQPAASIH